jgi:hypothetical protein
MRINRITLENFRAFQSEQSIPIRPLTLIYGKNASGKSALIDAFRYWQDLLGCERKETPAYFQDDRMASKNTYGVGYKKPDRDAGICSRIEFVSQFDDETYVIDNKLCVSRTGKSDAVGDSPVIELDVNGLVFKTDASDVFGSFGGFFERLYRLVTENSETGDEWDDEREWQRVEKSKDLAQILEKFFATEERKKKLIETAENWFWQLGRIHISEQLKGFISLFSGVEYWLSQKPLNGFMEWNGFFGGKWDDHPDFHIDLADRVIASFDDPEDQLAFGNLMECCVGFCVHWLALGIHDPLYNYFNEFHCVPELREIPEKKQVYSRICLGGGDGAPKGEEYDFSHDGRYRAGDYLINRKVLKDANEWLQSHQNKGMQFELIAQDVTYPDGSIIGKVFAVKDTQRDLILSFEEVGTGISQFLPVVLWCMEPPELFAIKQPELHLHPGMQSELGDLLLSCRKTSAASGNVIVETHSEHILLRVLRRIRETQQGTVENEVDRVTPDDVCVLYVENLGDRSIVRHMPISEDGRLIHDWPGGFFEEGLRELLM